MNAAQVPVELFRCNVLSYAYQSVVLKATVWSEVQLRSAMPVPQAYASSPVRRQPRCRQNYSVAMFSAKNAKQFGWTRSSAAFAWLINVEALHC